MKKFTAVLGLCVCCFGGRVFAAKCAPEFTPSSMVAGAFVGSLVSMGNTANAIGGNTISTCGLIISDQAASVKSAYIEMHNINAAGATAVSVVNSTNAAVAFAKGTIEGHGVSLSSDAPRQRLALNTSASIVGVGSMLVAGGESSQTDPPPGVKSQNIRDMSGKIYYNRVNVSNVDLITGAFSKAGVTANMLQAFGGTSSANTDEITADGNGNSTVVALASSQAGDTATGLMSAGFKMGDGDAAMGDTGTAAANNLALSKSSIRAIAAARAGNQATMLSGISGKAMANSINISDLDNGNAIAVSMAGNSAMASSAMGIPGRPQRLPETSVVSNGLSISKGSASGVAYAFAGNSSTGNQAVGGGSIKVNTVNLSESDHAGVATTLTGNTGMGASAMGFMQEAQSGSSAAEVKGSSVTLNSVSHSARSRVNGGALTLLGNSSQGAMALVGGSVTENSILNGENASMQGGTAGLMGNVANGSSASASGSVLTNSINNGGAMQGASVQVAQNTSTAAVAMGQGSSAQVNSVINSSRTARMNGTVVGVTANRGINPVAQQGGKVLVNSVSNDNDLVGVMNVTNNFVSQGAAVGNEASLKSNSISNAGRMTGFVTVANNLDFGSAAMTGAQASQMSGGQAGGVTGAVNVNSIVNGSNGTLTGPYTVQGNMGIGRLGANVNSILNNGGTMTGLGMLQTNIGQAFYGGTTTSIVNERGTMTGMMGVAANTGASQGPGSYASSIVNAGMGNLTGTAVVANSFGTATAGGIATSIVNRGTLTAFSMITGSMGTANGSNAIASSIVNDGTITGPVGIFYSTGQAAAGGTAASIVVRPGASLGGSAFILGTNGNAGGGRVHGSIAVESGAAGGAFGVIGNFPAGVGADPYLFPDPMISQSIVVRGTARAYVY